MFSNKSNPMAKIVLGAAVGLTGTALLSVGVAGVKASVTVSETLYPSDTASSGDPLPTGYTGSYAPGYASSSWESNGNKLELYLSPGYLGFSTINLGSTGNNLSSISYWTDKLNAVQGDWYINLYTNTTGSNDAASWYHDRLTFLTADGSYRATAATNTWTQATTGSGSDQLLLTAVNNTFLSSANYQTLGQVESSANYDTQTVKYITLTVASNATTLRSLVDGLQFSSGDGSTATFNLEAPEPTTLALFGIAGAGALLLLPRRKRQAHA